MKHESIESLEALLAGTCILLNDAATLQKKLNIPPENELFRAIADALLRTWDAREHIYTECPRLKPEFSILSEQHPELEEKYEKTIEEAAGFEQDGHFIEAIAIYQKYLTDAPEGFYRRSIEFKVTSLRLLAVLNG